jgi:hypothetical protein
MKKILHISMLSLLPMGYAWADVVSNFANEKSTVCKPFVVSDSTLFAGSFNTGGFAGGYTLSEVFLSIASVNLDATASNPGGTFKVQIWDSNGAGTPNTVLETTAGPGKTPAQGDNLKPAVLSYSSYGIHLNPNTKYWVSATVVGGNDLLVGLERTDKDTESSNPPGWSIGDSSLIIDGGAATLDDACVPYLKITAVQVPEPSSVALLGITGAGLMFLARRRK